MVVLQVKALLQHIAPALEAGAPVQTALSLLLTDEQGLVVGGARSPKMLIEVLAVLL